MMHTNNSFNDAESNSWQDSSIQFSPRTGASPNLNYHDYRQFRYPSPRADAFLCSTPRQRHGSPTRMGHNHRFDMNAVSPAANKSFPSPYYQSQHFTQQGNQRFWTPPQNHSGVSRLSHNRTLPPNYKQNYTDVCAQLHHCSHNPGGSNDISLYYNPSMLADPWADTPPISVSKASTDDLDLTHHKSASHLHQAR